MQIREATAIGRAGSEHMQKLADDIAWHRQQIRLISETIAAADIADNLSRDIEVATLKESRDRLERTLAHLLELQRARV